MAITTTNIRKIRNSLASLAMDFQSCGIIHEGKLTEAQRDEFTNDIRKIVQKLDKIILKK